MPEAERLEILQTGPLMPFIRRQLDANFTVRELRAAADPDALLAELGPRLRGIAAGSHSLIGRSLFERLPKLEIVANFGVGYDSIDAAEAGRRGIVVTNTPDVLTEEVADLTLGLLIAAVRRIPQADRFLRDGRWLKGPFPLGPTLRTRKVGIVGLGRIGRAIARRLEAFGLSVAYHGRRRQEDAPYRYYPRLHDMAQDVDTLVAVAPGGEATRHLIGAEVLKALGPQGVVVNVGRGSVVDETALIQALSDGTILAAGLDVFEDEPNVPAALIAMENAVLLPHVGSASVHTREAMGQLMVDNLLSWFAGRGPITPVAETPWPRKA